MIDLSDAVGFFRANFDTDPSTAIESPGRINYIGEHTDYNGGLALPIAIDRGITVVVGDGLRGTKIRATSAGQRSIVDIDLDDLVSTTVFDGWSRYLLGGIKVLLDEGYPIRGVDISISSDLQLGSGLSSSAALLLAVVYAITLHNDINLSRDEVVELAHRAEGQYAGANVGYLDHYAIGFAMPRRATFIDFSTMSHSSCEIPFDELLVVDSNVHHSISSGGYGERRRECERAAEILNRRFISGASVDEVQTIADVELRLRAMHVLEENARVEEVRNEFSQGKTGARMLLDSHKSLRDQFRVSCPETDLIVESSIEAGAEGARMVGGGFGGSCIVVGGDPSNIERVVRSKFASGGFGPPSFFIAALDGSLKRVL
ncbi:MAG: hypothetical protein M0019_07730 [Actinomycetota bacterium]|nr:hypothetical protein [Actinomycetota bacterium]